MSDSGSIPLPHEPDAAPTAAKKPIFTRRRVLRGIGLYVVVPYVAVALILTAFQRRLLYTATVVEELHPADAYLTGTVETLRLRTPDGNELRGWWLPSSKPNVALDRTVLYFPGNSGNRATHAADCRDFTSLGCNVVIFDYRGYGDTPGSPSEAALHADAETIWRFLINRGIPADQIMIFGESLGGGVATRLAATACRNGEVPAALVLSSTFAELADAVVHQYPYFPVRLLLFDRYRSYEHIGDVACPLVMFHGEDDDTVPLDSARRLFAAAPEESREGIPKTLITLPGEGHNSIPTGAFRDTVNAMLSTPTRRN